MKNWIRGVVLMSCVSAVALAPFAEADAALNAYLTLKGQKSGQIKGSVQQKGREGAIAVIAVSHEIVSPRDMASGQATGKRMHKPFVITKELDRSTPRLNAALVANERLPEVTFTVYQPNPKGGEVLAYTIRFTEAAVSSIQLRNTAEGKLVEEVSFVYDKIEWIWADGGVTAADTWKDK